MDSCRACSQPSCLACSHCESVSYCSEQCATRDWQVHALVCTKISADIPPPFPIPREIAFISQQNNMRPEYGLYGSDLMMRTLVSRYQNTAEYASILKNELPIRRAWVRAQLDKPLDPQWKFHLSLRIANFKGGFLGPTHSKETWRTMESEFASFEAKLQSTRDPRLVYPDLIEYCLGNDDFVLNYNHFGPLMAYPFLGVDTTEMDESNRRLHSARRTIYRRLQSIWESNQPSYDSVFSVAMTWKNQSYARSVAKGVLFYRGQGHQRSPIPRRDTAWFGIDPWTAMTYIVPDFDIENLGDYCERLGTISAFRAKEIFIILDMSSADNVARVRNLAATSDPDMLEIFDELWQIQPDGRVRRRSEQSKDVMWVQWLCAKGYSGYIAGRDVGLHPELFLCTWHEHLEYAGTYETDKILQTDFCQVRGGSKLFISSK